MKQVQHLVICLHIDIIERRIKLLHCPDIGGDRIIRLVTDKEDVLSDRGIFKGIFPVEQDRSMIGLIDAGNAP